MYVYVHLEALKTKYSEYRDHLYKVYPLLIPYHGLAIRTDIFSLETFAGYFYGEGN